MIPTTLAEGGHCSRHRFPYTVAGDMTSLVDTLNGPANNLSYTLGYTPAHELASEAYSNTAYEIQPTAGTDSFAAVNTLNQYPSVTLAGQGASSLAYDGNGNLTSGGGWTYAYDSENKLMTAANGSTVSATYAYDPLGRRTEKSGTGVATTFFLNDGSDEIAEYGASGTVLRRFVPGPAINEPIVYENCAGATAPNCTGSGVVDEYFQTDHHGSVVAMTGASAAPVEGPYSYDTFGNGGPLTGEPFKYVGMYQDAETGLYYDRARYYSPTEGRFLQTDPIGYKDDLDMYTYVGNDPVDRTDPTGLWDCDKICQDVQDKTKKELQGKVANLKSLRNKLASGERLSPAEKLAADLMDKYLGGHSDDAVGGLIKQANSMIDVINAKGHMGIGPLDLSNRDDAEIGSFSHGPGSAPETDNLSARAVTWSPDYLKHVFVHETNRAAGYRIQGQNIMTMDVFGAKDTAAVAAGYAYSPQQMIDEFPDAAVSALGY